MYGTSIAQKDCAYRPGITWSTLLQRAVDYPLINFGFSGWGESDKKVFQFMNELDARLHILNYLPNLPGEKSEEITTRIIAAVKKIRGKHTTPILIMECMEYSNVTPEIQKANNAFRQAYKQIQKEGVRDVYYLTREELNLSANRWEDGFLPGDSGTVRYAMAVDVNLLLKRMAEAEGVMYADPGILLTLPNGKIDESLFTDGTHPNEKGYGLIVTDIVKF